VVTTGTAGPPLRAASAVVGEETMVSSSSPNLCTGKLFISSGYIAARIFTCRARVAGQGHHTKIARQPYLGSRARKT
jgi:hypothetical protein